MSRWDELFTRMRRLESERLEAERRQREADEARRDQEAWAEAALDSMWSRVMHEVDERAKAFTQSTGRSISVVRNLQTLEGTTGLAALRILELRLGDSIVYLYSHHASGSHVHVHVAQWPAPDGARRRHHRMISLPVCTLERVGRHDWALARVAKTGQQTLKVEDVVYRAFELLVFSLERTDPRVLGLQTVADADPRSSKTVADADPRSSKTVMQFPD